VITCDRLLKTSYRLETYLKCVETKAFIMESSSEPMTKFAELMDNNNAYHQQAYPSTGMTAPVVTLNTNTPAATTNTTIATAPMVDTTMIPVRGGPKPTTRIEGMEALESQPSQDQGGHVSESEKRMKEEELSFYSASDNEHGDDNIWGLLSGVGGNIYEWYVLLSLLGTRIR
jgi:hypothetical protein